MLIENLVGLHPSIRRIKQDTEKLGFTQALHRELSRLGIHPRINCSPTTAEIMQTAPVLTLGHHTGHGRYFGTLEWLASLPDRQDITLFGDVHAIQLYLGRTKMNNLLEVESVSQQVGKSLRSKLITFFGYLLLDNHQLTKREKTLKNKANYPIAIARLDAGGLVALAPDASQGPEAKWFHRTGEIINGLKTDSDAQIVMAYINNNSDLALRALLPFGRLFVPQSAKNDQVFLSEPLSVAKLRERLNLSGHPAQDNRQTTAVLQEIYRSWKASL